LRRCTRRYSSQREEFHPADFRSAKIATKFKAKTAPDFSGAVLVQFIFKSAPHPSPAFARTEVSPCPP
jgi:hypothetical protein